MDKKDLIVYVGNKPWVKPVIPILRDYGFNVWVENGTSEDDEMLAKAWGLVPGRTYVTDELLDKAPNLKIICKSGVGLDRIDIPACSKRGIVVANTPKSNMLSVAEHTMGLMLGAAKNLYPIGLYIRRDYPAVDFVSRYNFVELYGKTLLVIGVGNIGTRVAKLAEAFDMKILGVDPFIDHSERPDYITWYDTQEEALPLADFVTVHVSGIKENANLIGAEQFALMKETAIFVNASRGFVVDEKALYDALANKKIAAAGLDVFVDDPLKPNNPLLRLENLICTPHCAAATPESKKRGMQECCRLINEFAEGVVPYSAVNETQMA